MEALRYSWRTSPCNYKQCAVYSVDSDLPAPPIVLYKKQLNMADGSGNVFSITMWWY